MRGDWVRLLLATDEIIPRRADGFGMSVLSERATSLLAFLRSIPDSAACDACMAAHLGVDRYDVLKAIRELVLTGRVMCTFRGCSVCLERRLIATFRTRRDGGRQT